MMTFDDLLTADDLLQHANAAVCRGDLEAALRYLNDAFERSPENAELTLSLGHVKLNLGDLDGALESYSAGARLRPNMASAHSSRALVLQLLGVPVEAEQAAVRALALNARDIVALKVIARIHLDDQNIPAVQKVCRQILKLNPGDEDARAMLAASQERQNDRGKRPCADLAGGRVSPSSAGPAFAPAPVDKIKSLENLLGDYAARTLTWRSLGAEHLMQQFTVGSDQQPISIQSKPAPLPKAADGFPIPPVELTMGYGAGDLERYLATGRRSYEVLSGLLADQRIKLRAGDAMLDWGCAGGRAVRQFVAEAKRGCHVWGCDVHAPSIVWAQAHLSPPFKFFNSSTLPHLPFPEDSFKFIYGLSVFTHLVTMRDLWLLELHRVLRRNGCLILTIHDEHTWTWFRERGMPSWMPRELRNMPALPGECVDIRGSSWEHCYTFFRSDYVRRVWSQYFKVAKIIPRADSYQAAVVLRKI